MCNQQVVVISSLCILLLIPRFQSCIFTPNNTLVMIQNRSTSPLRGVALRINPADWSQLKDNQLQQVSLIIKWVLPQMEYKCNTIIFQYNWLYNGYLSDSALAVCDVITEISWRETIASFQSCMIFFVLESAQLSWSMEVKDNLKSWSSCFSLMLGTKIINI